MKSLLESQNLQILIILRTMGWDSVVNNIEIAKVVNDYLCCIGTSLAKKFKKL